MNFKHSGKKLRFNLFFTFSFILLSNFGYGQVKSWEGSYCNPNLRMGRGCES